MLDNANNKNTSHEGLLWKFENDKRDLEERHRDDLNSMQIKLNKKEEDIYKMEQLLLQINHSIDEAKQEKENAKIEFEMCKIEKIRIEEQTKYIKE